MRSASFRKLCTSLAAASAAGLAWLAWPPGAARAVPEAEATLVRGAGDCQNVVDQAAACGGGICGTYAFIYTYQGDCTSRTTGIPYCNSSPNCGQYMTITRCNTD
jgi:hypothetical protein